MKEGKQINKIKQQKQNKKNTNTKTKSKHIWTCFIKLFPFRSFRKMLDSPITMNHYLASAYISKSTNQCKTIRVFFLLVLQTTRRLNVYAILLDRKLSSLKLTGMAGVFYIYVFYPLHQDFHLIVIIVIMIILILP